MEEPIIQKQQQDGILKFSIENLNVVFINAIRRTILSDIPIFVFRTTPHEENMADITINTTRLNNEIIKQRLACIPIHVSDMKMPFEKYIIEVNKQNNTSEIQYITTEDFMIKDITIDEYLDETERKKWFPANYITNQYIDFVRLRPKITDDLPGEQLSFKAKLGIGSAKESGSYNVVSTCSFGNIIDEEEAERIWNEKEKELHNEYSDAQIKEQKDNWFLLEAKRYSIPNSFNFILESIGIFTNHSLIKQSCNIINAQLEDLLTKISIEASKTTMNNAYDIKLENKDYTIGKLIEYAMYYQYYEKEEIISYISFFKTHPHDNDGILRIAFNEATDEEQIRAYIYQTCQSCIKIYTYIISQF